MSLMMMMKRKKKRTKVRLPYISFLLSLFKLLTNYLDTEEDDLELEDESANKNKEKEGLDSEHIATLERLKANQRQDYLHGTVTGSVQASDRLMKELRDIYRSETFKKGSVSSFLDKIFFIFYFLQCFSWFCFRELHHRVG